MSVEQAASPPLPANVLRLEGNADIAAARRLLIAARAHVALGGDVVVDCTALGRIDGAGAQLLLALKRKLESAGRGLRLEAVPERAFERMLANGVGAALVTDAPMGPVIEAQRNAAGAGLHDDTEAPSSSEPDVDPDTLFGDPQ